MRSSWRPPTKSACSTPCAIPDPWLIVLHAARGGPAWRRVLRDLGSPDALLGRPDSSLAAAGLDDASIGRLRRPDAAALDATRHWLDEPGHALVTYDSGAYPRRLAEIPDSPLALWADGRRLDLLNDPQIAVVGSRNATRGGRETARRFAEYLSRSGFTVTSGLAAGIDAASHDGAVGGASGTIAVLGCGIDRIYPREHEALAERIRAAGAIVSEYPPGVPPLPHQFPDRNRIIAGLAIGTLIVEAGRRSGALITARRATEYGRDVFAIPGSIHNPLARGCHALIRQGAKLVEDAADILVELAPQLDLTPQGPEPVPEGWGRSPLLSDDGYRNLLNCLEFEPVPFAVLERVSGLTTAELSSMLLLLELDGLVEALPGGRYCRVETRSR